MAIDGLDLRERPWQPGLDDSRFNQQPRNPNFSGGPSPQAAAYQRTNDLRGMSATERPWARADTRTFGTRPAGVAPPISERLQGARDTLRDGVDGARSSVMKGRADRAVTAAVTPQPGRVARATRQPPRSSRSCRNV